jgi:exodeoxyribonuclease VII small subunit
MMAKATFDYTAKASELETVLAKLQNPDIQIDEATKLYDTGLKLVDEIEAYLQQAENTVRKHTAAE